MNVRLTNIVSNKRCLKTLFEHMRHPIYAIFILEPDHIRHGWSICFNNLRSIVIASEKRRALKRTRSAHAIRLSTHTYTHNVIHASE